MSPQKGRPKAEKPKIIEVKARIDEETYARLLEYCKMFNVRRTDVIRDGIEKVLKKK